MTSTTIPNDAMQTARDSWEQFYVLTRELNSKKQPSPQRVESEIIKPVEKALQAYEGPPCVFSIACRNMLAWAYGQTNKWRDGMDMAEESVFEASVLPMKSDVWEQWRMAWIIKAYLHKLRGNDESVMGVLNTACSQILAFPGIDDEQRSSFGMQCEVVYQSGHVHVPFGF